MKIGELARRSGVGIDTVRYYEREGLLPMSLSRSEGQDMRTLKATARRKLIEIDARLAELRRIRAGLAALVEACPGRDRLDACPILNALTGDPA